MINTYTDAEVKDLTLSTLGLGLAFAIVFFGGPDRVTFLTDPAILPAFIVSSLLVGVSFIPHEMSHRAAARVIEAYAEYEMWRPGVLLAIATSLFGVVFAAPGGIKMYIVEGERYGRWHPELSPHHIGLVAAVGPLMNVSMAMVFFFLANAFNTALLGMNVFVAGAGINAYLALFNLIPIHPMDGYKVLRWNIPFYGFMTALAVLTFALVFTM